MGQNQPGSVSGSNVETDNHDVDNKGVLSSSNSDRFFPYIICHFFGSEVQLKGEISTPTPAPMSPLPKTEVRVKRFRSNDTASNSILLKDILTYRSGLIYNECYKNCPNLHLTIVIKALKCAILVEKYYTTTYGYYLSASS